MVRKWTLKAQLGLAVYQLNRSTFYQTHVLGELRAHGFNPIRFPLRQRRSHASRNVQGILAKSKVKDSMKDLLNYVETPATARVRFNMKQKLGVKPTVMTLTSHETDEGAASAAKSNALTAQKPSPGTGEAGSGKGKKSKDTSATEISVWIPTGSTLAIKPSRVESSDRFWLAMLKSQEGILVDENDDLVQKSIDISYYEIEHRSGIYILDLSKTYQVDPCVVICFIPKGLQDTVDADALREFILTDEAETREVQNDKAASKKQRRSEAAATEADTYHKPRKNYRRSGTGRLAEALENSAKPVSSGKGKSRKRDSDSEHGSDSDQ